MKWNSEHDPTSGWVDLGGGWRDGPGLHRTHAVAVLVNDPSVDEAKWASYEIKHVFGAWKRPNDILESGVGLMPAGDQTEQWKQRRRISKLFSSAGDSRSPEPRAQSPEARGPDSWSRLRRKPRFLNSGIFQPGSFGCGLAGGSGRANAG